MMIMLRNAYWQSTEDYQKRIDQINLVLSPSVSSDPAVQESWDWLYMKGRG